ncbi:MAG: hypothetical protein KY463_13490 [Actinobacteria bacterium]|nr:hypothetical protein [Actinomycetota bacterium]
MTLQFRLSRGDARRRSISVLVVVVAALLAGALAPNPASASATGYAFWAPFGINIGGQTIGVPSGQLTHVIVGSGTYISRERAHILTKPGFCNWRVDFVYKNVHNRVYRRIGTRTKYGCDTQRWAPTVYPGRVRRGTACAQLYRSGVFVVKQCHSIF